MEVFLNEITIGERHRKELGDIEGLAASIEAIGLLHPIVLDGDKNLVAGERRIAAFQHLGRDKIPATVARNMSDLHLALQAECDENTCRKDFSPEEAVAIGENIEMTARPMAEKRQKEAGEHGTEGGRGKKKPLREVSIRVSADREARVTTAIAASAVNMDRRTYEKAKAVIKSGNQAAIERMRETGKVAGAFKMVREADPPAVSPLHQQICDDLRRLLTRIDSIYKQFGSAEAMLKTKGWKSANLAVLSVAAREVSEKYGRFYKEVEAYAEAHQTKRGGNHSRTA